MSYQINLYDPTLLERKQWLTAANLLLAVAALCLVLAAWGAWERIQATSLSRDEGTLADQTKAARDEALALGAQLANRRPDPKLELDVAAMKELLGVRQEILAALEPADGAASVRYSEYLRGLARQTIPGLWLTGFAVGPDGNRMEIRGRTLDPALLPQYIHRLEAEPAFRGRRFAALTISVPPAPSAPGQPLEPSQAPPYHEFALVPDLDTHRKGGTQ